MVDAYEVEDGGMQVVVGDALVFGLVAHIIALADLLATLDAGARHEDGHRAGVVAYARQNKQIQGSCVGDALLIYMRASGWVEGLISTVSQRRYAGERG